MENAVTLGFLTAITTAFLVRNLVAEQDLTRYINRVTNRLHRLAIEFLDVAELNREVIDQARGREGVTIVPGEKYPSYISVLNGSWDDQSEGRP
jgi:hypothetical protein